MPSHSPNRQPAACAATATVAESWQPWPALPACLPGAALSAVAYLPLPMLQDALPTPFGLVRSGVAPDHADTKARWHALAPCAQDPVATSMHARMHTCRLAPASRAVTCLQSPCAPLPRSPLPSAPPWQLWPLWPHPGHSVHSRQTLFQLFPLPNATRPSLHPPTAPFAAGAAGADCDHDTSTLPACRPCRRRRT